MGVKVKERPKGSGIWWVFIHHRGKRRAKKIGKDKRLAREIAMKIEAKLALGEMGLDPDKKKRVPTLKEYVEGWQDEAGEFFLGWYEKVGKLSLKTTTRMGYRRILDVEILPRFGSKPLDEITSRMIGDFLASRINEGWRSATAKNVKNCLSAILRHACNPDGYISANPAKGVPIPRPEYERPAREPDPLTWQEREVIEEVFKKHQPRYYPLVLCGFRTGLRIGELIGLKWEDIDVYNRLILVQRNVAWGKITTPKSRSSRRFVRMTSQLVEALLLHRRSIKEEKLRKGWAAVPDWVFPSEEGCFINYGNFMDRIWNPTLEKSRLRRRTPHDMRHTYATLRLSKGDSLAEVSKEMGHSTPDITYRTYYKWLPTESRSNIDDLDGRGEKAQPNATYAQPEIAKGLALTANPLKSLEAATGFEPVNNGFADRCLTTWLCRRTTEQTNKKIRQDQHDQRDFGKKNPVHPVNPV